MAQITGIVKEVNTPKPGITVFIYERETGSLVDSTTSAGDGTFVFNNLDDTKRYTVTALSDNANFNDAIDDNLEALNVDPYIENVVLLCHFEGSDGSTIVLDNSKYEATSNLYFTGSDETQATITTSDSKFGSSCWRHAYAASGGFNNRTVWFPSISAYALTGDFTIEFWIKKQVFNSSVFTIVNGNIGTAAAAWQVVVASSGVYGFYSSHISISGGPLGSAFTISGGLAGQWQMICFSRSGNTIYGFIDGILKNTASCTGSIPTQDINLFGYKNNGFGLPNEWLQTGDKVDDLRITIGVCRYTSSYTVFNEAFPDY